MGCTVYQFLCRVAGAFGMLDGRIKAMYLTDSWLIRRSNGATIDFIRQGIRDCCRAGLAVRDGDELILPDFHRFIGWDTARKQEYRSQQKQETKPECPRTVPVLSENVPHPTLPNPTLPDPTNEQVSDATHPHPGKPGVGPDTLAVQEVFDYWKETLNHPRAKLPADPNDRVQRKLRVALKTFSVDDCKAAIRGITKDRFNMGENKAGKVYDGIEVIFRDSAQVNRFIAMDSGAGRDAGTTAAPQSMTMTPRDRASIEWTNINAWMHTYEQSHDKPTAESEYLAGKPIVERACIAVGGMSAIYAAVSMEGNGASFMRRDFIAAYESEAKAFALEVQGDDHAAATA